jgi:hypothetical protein
VPAGTPTFWGNSTARPAIVILPCSGTMSVVSGAWPVKNLNISANDSAEVADWTCVWLGTVTLIAPPIERPGVPLPAQMARVGTPPGGEVACAPSMFT